MWKTVLPIPPGAKRVVSREGMRDLKQTKSHGTHDEYCHKDRGHHTGLLLPPNFQYQ